MKTILIAEDNAINRELIREILEAHGHQVVETVDGRQTLDKIVQTPPDLVLLDIQMPGIDGYEVIRQLRGDPRFAKLQVIALTAFAMAGDEERALKAGFDGYMTKPIDIPAFTRRVDQALASNAPSI